MRSGSAFTFLQKKLGKVLPKAKQKKVEKQHKLQQNQEQKFKKINEHDNSSQSNSIQSLQGLADLQQNDLNVFIITFEGAKQAQKNLSGGDPYPCMKCGAILNKYSKIQYQKQKEQSRGIWICQFCNTCNKINIQPEQIPIREDVVYMLQSNLNKQKQIQDSTMIFCMDISGSMNSTSQIEGKIDLKYGLSQQEITLLKQFMEPGDQAQFNFLPGNHNNNKTFISRKQCILSAIQAQLLEIKKQNPYKKVGFITFNNQITVLGDSKVQTVHIVGDKLQNKKDVQNSLKNFKYLEPLESSHTNLMNYLNKTQPKGQTALGPALISAIQVASQGSPGSTIILCTDGLANIGIGCLQPLSPQSAKFYDQLAEQAKAKNISVNIITIKGQVSKMSIIGKLAQLTNGNVKVVNPEKLLDDFANVLKDEVVGINVTAKIRLHKTMIFRNEKEQNLFQKKSLLIKQLSNATVNTKISFQYEVCDEKDLKLMGYNLEDLKQIPFQTQIIYTNPNGGKYMRVISRMNKTTMEKQQMNKAANLPVIHNRITSHTANLFAQGDVPSSVQFNQKWANYLNNNFQEQKHKSHQRKFQQKNMKLNKAIKHKAKKLIKQQAVISQKNQNNNSLIDSDQDQMQIMNNLMQKQDYSFQRSLSGIRKRSISKSPKRNINKSSRSKESRKSSLKKERRRSIKRTRLSGNKKERRSSIKKIQTETKKQTILKQNRNKSRSKSNNSQISD